MFVPSFHRSNLVSSISSKFANDGPFRRLAFEDAGDYMETPQTGAAEVEGIDCRTKMNDDPSSFGKFRSK